MEVSDIRKRDARREEDYTMPIYLPYLPAILSIIGAVFVIVWLIIAIGPSQFPPGQVPWHEIGSFGGAVVGVFLGVIIFGASAILWIYVIYKWIDRRNNHFKRVGLLYEDIIDFLEEKGEKDEARNLRRSLREMESESDKKSAVVWVVLSIIIPIVMLYVFHFLTRDFFKHEKRENMLLEDIEYAINAADGSFTLQEYDGIEDRNTILYIVLTIITFGIFSLYWIYTITKDPNKHFKQSAIVEEELLNSLENI